MSSVTPVLMLASSPRYHTSLHCPAILRRDLDAVRVTSRAQAAAAGKVVCGAEGCRGAPWYDWGEGIRLTDKE